MTTPKTTVTSQAPRVKTRGPVPETVWVKSPAKVRAEFARKGWSFSAWAKKHKVSPTLLHEIVHGRRKCRIGQSHRIAVLLGMKAGEITPL